MSESCFASLDLCAIRTAKLDSGGNPTVGIGNGYVSDAMVKIDVGVEIEEGEEFVQKNGCGKLAATFKDADQVKRVTLAMDLALLDLWLLEQLAGFRLFLHTDPAPPGSQDQPRGFQFRSVGSGPPAPVSFECWTKAIEGDQVAAPAVLAGQGAWMHWVFPSTTWTQGQFTLEHGIAVFPVSGNGTENANITENGPYNDWPAEIVAGGGITAIGGMYYDDTLPPSACATIEVPIQA